MTGIELILKERERQLGKGWTPEHDDEHTNWQLSQAACCYGQMEVGGPYSYPANGHPPIAWPWEPEWWRPERDPIDNLVKAGALIAAEIDRVLRARKNDRRETRLQMLLAEAQRRQTIDPWSKHPEYPREDWEYEVDNQDTILGYWDWVKGQIELHYNESK